MSLHPHWLRQDTVSKPTNSHISTITTTNPEPFLGPCSKIPFANYDKIEDILYYTKYLASFPPLTDPWKLLDNVTDKKVNDTIETIVDVCLISNTEPVPQEDDCNDVPITYISSESDSDGEY